MDSTVLLFFEKMPQALPIYEAFTKRLLKELGPVQVKVQKSQIAFSNRYQFAFICTLPDGSGAERAFIWL